MIPVSPVAGFVIQHRKWNLVNETHLGSPSLLPPHLFSEMKQLKARQTLDKSNRESEDEKLDVDQSIELVFFMFLKLMDSEKSV